MSVNDQFTEMLTNLQILDFQFRVSCSFPISFFMLIDYLYLCYCLSHFSFRCFNFVPHFDCFCSSFIYCPHFVSFACGPSVSLFRVLHSSCYWLVPKKVLFYCNLLLCEQKFLAEHKWELISLFFCPSDQAHSSVERAGMLAGIKVQKVTSDDQTLAMRGPALHQAIQEDVRQGLVPFFVSAVVVAEVFDSVI